MARRSTVRKAAGTLLLAVLVPASPTARAGRGGTCRAGAAEGFARQLSEDLSEDPSERRTRVAAE
jgi:hypothetical protein